ncbi:predicted protein [Postia placenta Mad-698-R]|nr:predicted protein [Postia placenta Mad-698-R]
MTTQLQLHDGDIDLESTMGQVFIGVLFSSLAYGLTCAQSLFYAWNYPADSSWQKTMDICIGPSTHYALVSQLTQNTRLARAEARGSAFPSIVQDMKEAESEVFYQVPQFTHLRTQNFSWTFRVRRFPIISPPRFTQQFVSSAHDVHRVTHTRLNTSSRETAQIIVVFAVQCFFIHKIARLVRERRRQVALSACMLLFALASVGSGIGVSDYLFDSTHLRNGVPGSLQVVFALVTDAAITTALTCVLHGEKTQFRGMGNTLAKLMMHCSLRQFYFRVHDNPLMVSDIFHWHDPACTVYVNSLLAVLIVSIPRPEYMRFRLNVRHHLRAQAAPVLRFTASRTERASAPEDVIALGEMPVGSGRQHTYPKRRGLLRTSGEPESLQIVETVVRHGEGSDNTRF